jgi:hypothetical protein
MRRVHGNPIDTTRNSDDDGDEKKSTCVVSIASRVSSTTNNLRPRQKRVHTLRKGYWNSVNLRWSPFHTLRVFRQNRRGNCHLLRFA